MKILFVSPYISTTKNLEFYQSQQINLARELIKLNLKVTIATANRFDKAKKSELIDGVRIDYLKTAKWFPEKKLNQPFLVGLWIYLKKCDFDIIQTSEFHNISTLFVTFFCLLYKRKMIIYQGIYKDGNSMISKILYKIWDFLFGPMICRVTQLAICKTSTAKNYLKHKGIKHLKVISVGVNTSIFNSTALIHKKHNSKFKLLMVGSLIERKNYITTIQALKIVNQRGYNFELTIIGKGELESSIKDAIKYHSLNDDINLIPAIPNAEMKHYYTKADFTMMFSYNEIFGMTILEAMACGCPFISNFEPGPKDVINSRNGFQIRSDNPNQLAEGLISIFNSENLDRQKIEEETKMKYSWKEISKSYLNIYSELNDV